MASINHCFIRWHSGIIILLLILHLCQVSIAGAQSFCPATLARPTCPDLPTFEAFDISKYGGRWYEIGSSGSFKNLGESGGICVQANYTLLEAPSPGKGGVIAVENIIYGLGSASQNNSQIFTSLTADDICSQAFNICTQVDETKSSLAGGLALISNVSLAVVDEFPNLGKSLAKVVLKIEAAIAKINIDIENLSKKITKIQLLNAKLGQGEGNVAKNVESLVATATKVNATTIAIAKEVVKIEKERSVVEKVATTLAKKHGNDLAASSSSELTEATKLIKAAEDAISSQLQGIETSLAIVAGVVGGFLAPGSGDEGYTAPIVGQGLQNASFPGKLVVSFAGYGGGDYWILAVEEDTNDGGYAASLVYGCDQDVGRIEETLFLLSRTPSLPEATVERLLGKAAELGVAQDCSSPFIFTVQNPDRCGSAPSFIPPKF